MIRCETRDGLCIARLDSPPLNAITLSDLADLGSAIRLAVQEPGVRGVVLTGSPEHFSAGADIGIFQQIRTADDAVEICRRFQQALLELEDCSKPVVAVLAGGVMGGALELAMACHYRIATSRSRFSMPEVGLGINPGAGGTQRLPRLAGVSLAIKMLLSGKSLDAEEAIAAGLIDSVCDSSQGIERARSLVESAGPRKTRLLAHKLADRVALETALQEAESRVRGNATGSHRAPRNPRSRKGRTPRIVRCRLLT